MATEKVQYRVKKITIENRICPFCRGIKTREINLGNGIHKTVNCSSCDGSGVFRFEHITEISLKTALLELGIETLIQNTVSAMQSEIKTQINTDKG